MPSGPRGTPAPRRPGRRVGAGSGCAHPGRGTVRGPHGTVASHELRALAFAGSIVLDTYDRQDESSGPVGLLIGFATIKAGRVGGYLEARRVRDVATTLGVPVRCGGMLETGIGRAANLALASLPGFTLTGDISGSSRYYREDVTPPFLARDGRMAVPDGPGIGVEVDEERIAGLTTHRQVVTR
ncbi:MAG: Mandelate racemase/muconate lactonizing protein [Modestobacter sp.]|nr:Mandelate racemase/muconate lactonizing protein [Modestobacter sp.]